MKQSPPRALARAVPVIQTLAVQAVETFCTGRLLCSLFVIQTLAVQAVETRARVRARGTRPVIQTLAVQAVETFSDDETLLTMLGHSDPSRSGC